MHFDSFCWFFLLLLNICYSNFLHFDESRNLLKNQRLVDMEKLLISYKTSHEYSTLASLDATELCRRRFIVSHAACRDAGNGIGTFLDNLAWYGHHL